VERWFGNTRGLVVVVLAIATCVLLLAIEPGDGFPNGVGVSSGGDSPTVTTPSTTAPVSTTTIASGVSTTNACTCHAHASSPWYAQG